MDALKKKIEALVKFIKTDIWKISGIELTRGKAFVIKYLKVIVLTVHGFNEDRVRLRASALTFYTLLAVVPVMAMIFGIAKGFGFEKVIQKQLLERFAEHEIVLLQIIHFSDALLKNTKGGLLAGIGVVLLLWAVIKISSQIEFSLNDIWNIKTSRSFLRKVTDYLTIALICPIFLVVSSSATVFFTTQVKNIVAKVTILEVIGPGIFFILKILPYGMIWFLFCFIYIVMPNTKVNFGAGFFGALVAGTAFQIIQWLYINFQIGVASYNAIYGSFAALPLFLIWLQISWLVVLFGAEISFSLQNIDTYEFEQGQLDISPSDMKLFSLLVAHHVVKNFSKGEKPLNALQIAGILKLPLRLVRQILFDFVKCNIFSKLDTLEYKEPAYQPARDTNFFTIHHVVKSLEKCGTDSITMLQTNELETLSEALINFSDTINKSPANVLLKDI